MRSAIEDRFWAKVDKSSDCWNWIAYKRNGYGRFKVGAAILSAHRVSWEMAHGPVPEGLAVDHKCFNKACVRPDHLRVATIKQNSENRPGAQPNSRTGERGVSWHRSSRKWRAQASHNGHRYHGGTFDSLEEAIEAARQLRLSLFTHNDLDRK